jgi:threonine dehydratase
VSSALKSLDPEIRVVGVESSGAPAMQRSVAEGRRVELEEVHCSIDGLKVKRVGEHTLDIVTRMVDEIVTLPDERIFDALLWTLARTKIVVEGAAAAPVAALLNGLVSAPRGSKVVAVLSGGNVDLDQLRGLTWN